MSHAATNWAITQRGLKPATRVVLWHLCDRHNPDQGCFPSQDKLAYDCEMSRSALNEHLKILEAKGLIRREQRINPKTKQQESTSYALAFEPGFVSASKPVATQGVVEPCPETGHGAVSGKEGEPCPENGESRVRNPDTNLVREPVIEPQEVRASAPWEGGFSIFWEEWPVLLRPDNRHHCAGIFRNLSEEARAAAVTQAATYRKLMACRKKPPRMVTYLRERLFAELDGAPAFDDEGRFIITHDRPEWSVWLGNIRSRFGERGVQSIVKGGRYLAPSRWPDAKAQAAA
ncbi:MAG: helix-turn-helix domain-containing protein [Mesorhizobium sp.]|nr:MAG: helix-turn-helix domain-containing protein [Mesorhizobium sp.]